MVADPPNDSFFGNGRQETSQDASRIEGTMRTMARKRQEPQAETHEAGFQEKGGGTNPQSAIPNPRFQEEVQWL